MENEQQIIRGCKDGDRKAQKALYDKYSRQMMGVCLRYVKEMESARDLLQDGFVCVFNGIGSFSGAGSFVGWMRKIFVNRALDYLRSNDIMREAEMLDDAGISDIADEDAIAQISADEIMAYVLMLPDGYRTVFNLYAVEGYSHKEISEMLNIKESSSRSQYIRARRMLQKMMSKYNTHY